MTMNFRSLAQTILIMLFIAGTNVELSAQSQVVEVKVHSPGLERNLLGDTADQDVALYLPAAYRREPERRFAAIYFLHGFADTPVKGVAELLQALMDKLIASDAVEPMIVVAPNGLNRYFGSFYTNSNVTGNWEDYVVDVVSYVDSHYRTLPSAESRGISGHSMGGYGALMLGFKHPDVFSNVYAMSPCCTVLDGDIGPSNPIWSRTQQINSADELPDILHREFLLAVAIAMDAAFAPDPQKPPMLGDPPFRRQGHQQVPDPAVLSKFQQKIVLNAIPSLLPEISKLKGVYID
jgi:S-formylglutathione hydrolase